MSSASRSVQQLENRLAATHIDSENTTSLTAKSKVLLALPLKRAC